MLFKSVRFWTTLIVSILLIAVIIQRVFIVEVFSSLYADHDQTLLWAAATEYRNFRFHEPFFWGQNYSVMIEALLAAPLLCFGIPHNYALPIATSVIFLSPIVSMSIVALKKKWYITALFAPLIILLMPLRFHLITSIPRGFVTGPSLAAIASIIALSTNSKWRFFWFSLIGMLSIAVLPSAILVILPVTSYLLLNNYKNLSYYRSSFIGFGIGAAIYGLMLLFYEVNKSYNYYGARNNSAFNYNISALISNVSNFERYFSDVTPTYLNNSYLFLSLFIVTVIALLYMRLYKQLSVIIFTVSVFVLSLGSGRVLNGSDSILLPYSRYYISGTFICIFIVWLVDTPIFESLKRNRFIATIFAFCLLAYTCLSISRSVSNISTHIENELAAKQDAVDCTETKYIYKECDHINKIATKYGANLIIGTDYILNYAYPALYPDNPPTLILLQSGRRQERRTWQIAEEFGKTRKRVLIYDTTDNPKYTSVYHRRPGLIYEDHWLNTSIYIVENTQSLKSEMLLKELGFFLKL